MKSGLIAILVLFCLNPVIGQKILVLENVRTMKNFKYYEGQKIILKVAGERGKVHDRIAGLEEGSVILEYFGEVGFGQIEAIYRENWLVRITQSLSFIGGTGYLALDSFNHLINKEGPVFQTETLIISGSMITFSAALIPFQYRVIRPGDKWKLKMIDLD
ncbi:MAG: hypothetical protein R6W71_12540 [Bacteroidales bacterium]|jgi:hypothetical protein